MKSKKRRAADGSANKRRAAKTSSKRRAGSKPARKADRTKQQCSVCLKAGHNARRHKKGKRSK